MNRTAPKASLENRRQPRHDTHVAAQLVLDGVTHLCTIENFSLGGVAVRCGVRPQFRQPITLQVESVGSFGGLVVHCTDGLIGILLQAPEADMRRLAQHLPDFAST